MPTPHIHEKEIMAWAQGMQIEYEDCGWHDCTEHPTWDLNTRYRVKPAAPKWPQTTMPEGLLVSKWYNGGPVNGADEEIAAMWRIVNAGIEYECSIGSLVPADKVREISAGAYAQGAKSARDPVGIIEAVFDHLRAGIADPESIQDILLRAAK